MTTEAVWFGAVTRCGLRQSVSGSDRPVQEEWVEMADSSPPC